MILPVSHHSFGKSSDYKEMMKRYRWILDDEYFVLKIKNCEVDKSIVVEYFSRQISPVWLLFNIFEYYRIKKMGETPL